MRVSNTALFVTAAAIWGSTWLAITFQLGNVAPEVSVAYRFAVASVILAAWCLGTGVTLRFSLRDHFFLAGNGATMFGLNYVGVYWAEQYVTSGLVAVIFATIVFMNPVAMRVAFGIPLTLRTLIAAALGVGGVALLFLPELESARHGGSVAVGIGYALGGTALASLAHLIVVRNHGAGLPTFSSTAVAMGYGAMTAALVTVFTGVRWNFEWTAAYIASLLYLAVFGSVMAFGAYLTLLKRVGPGPTSFVAVATPVIALLMSTLFEGYRWTWVACVGVVLAVAGNWLALRPAGKSGT